MTDGNYTSSAAATEGGGLGVVVAVAIAFHLFGSSRPAIPTASEVFYYQVLPTSAFFGLALGVGNAISLFFLARRLLTAQRGRDDA